MERLTEKAIGAFAYKLKDHKAVAGEFNTYEAFFDYSMAVKRLGEYEDAEEQGRLIVLPCKVGDTVYINTPSGATLCETVDSITMPEFRTKTLEGLRGLDFNFCEYGKTVFLSCEEAEKALEVRNVDL